MSDLRIMLIVEFTERFRSRILPAAMQYITGVNHDRDR
ncbi:hypothetical protein NIES2104_52320 [Leptolyngbya sp. NIES-2104]|nr:hypothetical protein NIES2104_52320 [Leptolyngbya sp. NIES-2104]